MRWLSRLQQRLEPYAIPNLPLWLIVGQGMLYGVALADPSLRDRLALIPNNVIGGEYWRLLSFIFMPPDTHPVWLFFALYFFHLTGSALEHFWGSLRFNLFLLIGYIATLAAAFSFPELRNSPHTNAFIGSSVFLAFAKLYPNYQISIYFIFPIRVYWIALLTWLLLITNVILSSSWAERCYVLAGILNYMLFFRGEIFRGAITQERRMRQQITNIRQSGERSFAHRCIVCGLTDADDPNMEFRYCSRCDGVPCYCSQHLTDHQHIEPKS